MQVELAWPERLDEALAEEIHAVVVDVVTSGGAVGWGTPPDRPACDAWVAQVLTEGGSLVVARVDGRVAALGTWSRLPAEVLAHNGEIRRVMVHRSARGLGLGRRVTMALIDSARAAGVEQLLCDVRGNNHAAVALYLSLGFREYGRLPDFLAVGKHRFDRVRLVLPLQLAPDVVLHGSRPEGPGASHARITPSGDPEGPDTAIAT
ncbi:MAG TPA: N-acetyltransferase [Frankiaceae bacterium]|nr:N-acetyltransferase [Frankiaceae bacterium]